MHVFSPPNLGEGMNTLESKKAVVLIGHGGVPKDFSREKVRRLVTLETERQRLGTPMSDEEQVLDTEIRSWPRNKENDPYEFGMKEIGKALAKKLGDTKLAIAYNEFCGPSVEDASETLISEGYGTIVYVSTMFTSGGIHSEFEIPEIIEALKKKHPDTSFEYRWPYDTNMVGDFLASQAHIDG